MNWFTFRNLLPRVPRFIRSKLSGSLSPLILSTFAAGACYFAFTKNAYTPILVAKKKGTNKLHEKRFCDFASVEYDGVLYMTPKDFLTSLVKVTSTNDGTVMRLKENDVQNILRKTPAKSKGSSTFLRELQTNGILSFTDYLFLLHILTKPHSGFEIAFKMLDTDMNGCVDVEEFSKLNRVVTRVSSDEGKESKTSSDMMVTREREWNTTLMTHLFGRKHTTCLTFEDFKRFMHNIQTESLEVEFQSHSLGSDTITETEFAKILLRHTAISSKEHALYIQRLQTRLESSMVITFKEFQKFFNFLNTLDDFSLAMRMYTIAERPIAMSEFGRAVKACTGSELDSNVLKAVYALFDIDGDGCLSYQEFVHIMRDRHARGLQDGAHQQTRIESFRHCVAKEMKKTN